MCSFPQNLTNSLLRGTPPQAFAPSPLQGPRRRPSHPNGVLATLARRIRDGLTIFLSSLERAVTNAGRTLKHVRQPLLRHLSVAIAATTIPAPRRPQSRASRPPASAVTTTRALGGSEAPALLRPSVSNWAAGGARHCFSDSRGRQHHNQHRSWSVRRDNRGAGRPHEAPSSGVRTPCAGSGQSRTSAASMTATRRLSPGPRDGSSPVRGSRLADG